MTHSDSTPVIEIRQVTRVYGEGTAAIRALGPLDLTIARGSFITIVGTSGSGKSTLLNLLGLLDTPSEGSIQLEGQDITRLNDAARTRMRRDRVGFIFQFFNLLPTMTATENVALPARLAGKSYRQSTARAQDLLKQVGLGERLKHFPNQLSGGEMQRVAIARALMLDPPVLLADEPTGNLDSNTGREIMRLLRGERTTQRTVVMVTHDPSMASTGDRMLRMGDGRILEDSVLS